MIFKKFIPRLTLYIAIIRKAFMVSYRRQFTALLKYTS